MKQSAKSNQSATSPTNSEAVRCGDWVGDLPQRVCPECGGGGTVADPKAIGTRMRELREKARLTGREVARRLGFSAMYVCDLEHGRRSWNAERITNYVNALRSPTDLSSGTGSGGGAS